MVALELTRRDVLAAILGPAAAIACARRPKVHELPGETYGPSAAIGHALRDFVPDPRAEVRELPIAIVGGGVAGLSAAWALLRRGARGVEVFELEGQLGGTSAHGKRGGLAYPWGAHYLPCPDADQHELIALLEEMGAVIGRDARGAPIFEESQLVVAPKERLYIGGAWSEGLYPHVGASAEDLRQLARFSAEIEGWIDRRGADGRRAFTLPLDRSSEDPEIRALDRITMKEWMDARGLDSPRLRWFVEYGTRDDYGTELAYTSAWAGLHYSSARTPARGDAGATATATAASAAERESAELLAWPSGNGAIVDHLAARVGAARIRCDLAIGRLLPAPDGRRVDLCAFDAKTRAQTRIRAERVVLAVPAFVRRVLLADHPERERLVDYSPPYAPWLVANLHLRGRPQTRGYPEAWDNVIYQGRGLGYVSATHQALMDHGPTVWTYYLPIVGEDAKAARERLRQLDRAQALDVIFGDLSRAHVGLLERVERVDLWPWGHGMARPEPGVLFGGDRLRARAPLGAIHFAHTDLSGVALFEEAFAHGLRVAAEVGA